MNRSAAGGSQADVASDRLVPGAHRAAAGPAPVEWAPVEACTLPTVEQPLREAEFQALFATALRGVERPAPTWLRLTLDAGVEQRTRDLIARESSCCSFFDFRLTAAGSGSVLDVRVPEARVEVLDGLAHEADTARAGGRTGSEAIA